MAAAALLAVAPYRPRPAPPPVLAPPAAPPHATNVEPKLITPGVIATEVNAPLRRVLRILATRLHIRPAARAGTLRLYDRAAVAMVRHELGAIAARRDGPKGAAMPAELPTNPTAPELSTTGPTAPTAAPTPTATSAPALALPATEAARLIGVSLSHFYQLHKIGRLPQPVRLGRAVRGRRQELADWLDAGRPTRAKWLVMKGGR